MHTVFALLCFVVVIHWLIFPYPSGLLHWHCASKATLMNMDKYFMWIHYERLHNHNKAKHNKTVCIFLGIYCICVNSFVSYTETVGFLSVTQLELRLETITKHWIKRRLFAKRCIWYLQKPIPGWKQIDFKYWCCVLCILLWIVLPL